MKGRKTATGSASSKTADKGKMAKKAPSKPTSRVSSKASSKKK